MVQIYDFLIRIASFWQIRSSAKIFLAKYFLTILDSRHNIFGNSDLNTFSKHQLTLKQRIIFSVNGKSQPNFVSTLSKLLFDLGIEKD